MTAKLHLLLMERIQNEKEIKKELAKLPSWGTECNCKRIEGTVDLQHNGSVIETFEHCCECGGVIM